MRKRGPFCPPWGRSFARRAWSIFSLKTREMLYFGSNWQSMADKLSWHYKAFSSDLVFKTKV